MSFEFRRQPNSHPNVICWCLVFLLQHMTTNHISHRYSLHFRIKATHTHTLLVIPIHLCVCMGELFSAIEYGILLIYYMITFASLFLWLFFFLPFFFCIRFSSVLFVFFNLASFNTSQSECSQCRIHSIRRYYSTQMCKFAGKWT